MGKKKFYLVLAFIIALSISGGVYANAYTSASDTIAIAMPTADMATSNVTGTQPNWNSVLTPVTDAITFRPNAAGDETGINEQYPVTGEHWDKVAEETADNDGTYVATDTNVWQEDLYNITNHSTQTAGGTINYVKVYMVGATTVNTTGTTAYIHIKTNGVEYNGSEEVLSIDYTTFSNQWNTNPQSGQPWTWNEIDNLQIGVGLRRPDGSEFAKCTQVYAEIEFEAPPLSASTPTGGLFVITPNPSYTGDLAVHVYLANTENLTKAYQSLNIRLYLEDSLEAGKTPDYRLLTLQNGMAAFTIVDGGSDNHTLASVSGDNYTLYSRHIAEWDTGWTVTPELYCEVTQR